MITTSDVVPRGALQIITIWSVLSLATCIVGLDFWSNNLEFAVDNLPVAYFIGSLAGCWLFAASWWILGGRVDENSTPDVLTADRWCRIGLVLATVAQMVLLTIATSFGSLLVTLLLAGSLTSLTWLVLYRQWSPKRLVRAQPVKQTAFGIRGLMALTVAAALVISVVMRRGRLEPEMIVAALVLGAVAGATWLGMMSWVLNGFPLSFLFSSVLLLVQAFVILGIATYFMMLDEDVVIELVKGSIGMGLLGILAFATLRAGQFRFAAATD